MFHLEFRQIKKRCDSVDGGPFTRRLVEGQSNDRGKNVVLVIPVAFWIKCAYWEEDIGYIYIIPYIYGRLKWQLHHLIRWPADFSSMGKGGVGPSVWCPGVRGDRTIPWCMWCTYLLSLPPPKTEWQTPVKTLRFCDSGGNNQAWSLPGLKTNGQISLKEFSNHQENNYFIYLGCSNWPFVPVHCIPGDTCTCKTTIVCNFKYKLE